MCLDRKSMFKPSPTGIGYKIMETNEDRPGVYEAPFFDTRHKEGRWYTAKEKRVYMFDSRKWYKSGFHIYQEKRDAINERKDYGASVAVVQVEYEGAHTTGPNDEHSDRGLTVVARRMRIIRRIR